MIFQLKFEFIKPNNFIDFALSSTFTPQVLINFNFKSLQTSIKFID